MNRRYNLYTYTIIRTGGEAFKDKTPYVFGLLEDENGHRKVAYMDRYIEGTQINIGDKVEFNYVDETGLDVYKIVN